MAKGDVEKQNKNLQQAQKIVRELTSCLDMNAGGEIARNLFSLYGYVHNELVRANMGDEHEPVDRCIRILSELRESWMELNRAQASVAQAA